MTFVNPSYNKVAEQVAEDRLRKIEGNFGMIKDPNERKGLKMLFRNQAAMEINSAYVKMLSNVTKN